MAGPFTLAPERKRSSNTEQPKPANPDRWLVRAAASARLAPNLNTGKGAQGEGMFSGLVRFAATTVSPGMGLWRSRSLPSTPVVLPITAGDLREDVKPRRVIVRSKAGMALALPSLASDQTGLPANGA